MSRLTPLSLYVLLFACGSSRSVVEPAPPAAAANPAEPAPEQPVEDAAARRAMLDALLGEIRRVHVFSDVWPRERWEAEVPTLSRAILGAPDREALHLALTRLANSLHDGHLRYRPTAGNGSILTLPLNFHATGPGDVPVFVVERADEGVGVRPGDRLVAYDGTSASELLERFRYDVPVHPPAARAARLANMLQSSNRYPIEVRLGADVIGSLEVALDRTRLGDDGPWMEGRGLRLDRTIVPTWPLADYEREMIDGAIELLRAER